MLFLNLFKEFLVGGSRVHTAGAQEVAAVTGLLGGPLPGPGQGQGQVPSGFVGQRETPVHSSGGGLVIIGLTSSSRVQPSVCLCILGNRPSHVSGQRGLLSWPPCPPVCQGWAACVTGGPLLSLAAPWLSLRPIGPGRGQRSRPSPPVTLALLLPDGHAHDWLADTLAPLVPGLGWAWDYRGKAG